MTAIHNAFNKIFAFAFLMALFLQSSASNNVSKLVDSIENQNLYAHDSIKIKNYITIHENLNGRQLDTSLYFIDRAIHFDSVNQNIDELAELYLLKAQILEDLHNYTMAIAFYKKAIDQAVESRKGLLLPQIYNSFGGLHIKISMYDDAFIYFMKALDQCNKDKDPDLYATILNNIGFTHQVQNQYSKALEYFKQTLVINKELKVKKGVAIAYNNIGAMYFMIGAFDSVLYYFNEALMIYKEMDNKKEQAIPLFNLGETYFELEDYKNATEYILQAYEIDKEFNDKSGMSKSLNFLGKIYSQQNYLQYSLKLYEQALELCKEINDDYELKDIYFNISNNYEKLGKYKKSLDYFKLYSDLNDKIFNLESANKIFELETKYQSKEQKREIENKDLILTNKEHEIRQQFIQKILILTSLILILIFFLIIYRSYQLKNKTNTALLKQKEQISLQNKKITSSIQYAKLIQTAALPPHELLKDIFHNHFILFLPRDIVSGDFFWATKKGNRSVVVCADCTGHGVPGAFMSMLGVSFLTEIVNRSEKLQSEKILEDLRQNVMESLHQTGKIGESRDGMDIALCIIDHENMELEYSGAFIPLIVIRDNNIIQISADKMPIGVHDEILHPFTPHKIKLLKGDMIYMFTDGYADQFGGSNNKKFKMQPFLSLLLAQHHKEVIKQREILYESILNWRGDHEQIDDILVMGFRV